MGASIDDLPGRELVAKGLEDLEAGAETALALLVAIGAPRLRRLGLAVPAKNALPQDPELRLYRLLCKARGLEAYSEYNALLRRLTRLEQALEHRWARRRQVSARPAGLGPKTAP